MMALIGMCLLCFVFLCFALKWFFHSAALLGICWEDIIALLCFALLCFALHCFALYCFALHSFALLCFAFHCLALLCFALLCFALLCFALLCVALHRVALHCFSLLCFVLLCFALRCFALLLCFADSFESHHKLPCLSDHSDIAHMLKEHRLTPLCSTHACIWQLSATQANS